MRRNDKITVEAVVATAPEAIVLSPGPCTPNEAGICLDLIARAAATIPILGVCLGHQAIGQAFGGEVVRAPVPMHGKLSLIRHDGQGIFRGINAAFKATRYHSLMVERATLPDDARGDRRDRRRADHGAAAPQRCRCTACSSIPRASRPSTATTCCGISSTSPATGTSRRAAPPAIAGRSRRTEGSHMVDLKTLLGQVATGAALTRDEAAEAFDSHDVGRGDAVADRRPPDGAARARRDGRRDHRRRHGDARQDAAGRRAAGRHRRGRHRRRRVGHLQHLHLRGLRRGRRRRAGRQARQPRPLVALRRRRRARRARRQDRPAAGAHQRAASRRPGSASCSRRPIIRR